MTHQDKRQQFRFKDTQRQALTKILEKELSIEASAEAVTSMERSISQYSNDVAGCTSRPALYVLGDMFNELTGLNAEFHARFEKYRALAESYHSGPICWEHDDLDAVPSQDSLCVVGINDSDLTVVSLIVEQVERILTRSVVRGSNAPDKSLRALCGSVAGVLSHASGEPVNVIRKKEWFKQVIAVALNVGEVQISPAMIALITRNLRQRDS